MRLYLTIVQSICCSNTMISTEKIKVTSAKRLLYLGGAIWEGQDIQGVETTPDLFRQANLFKSLQEKYQVETVDLGNISAVDHQPTQTNEVQANHHMRNLQLLDDLLGQINNRILTGLKEHPDSIMLTVGGDHAVGTPTLHALHTHYKDLKVIWVDAHPDLCNPGESHYQNYHGFPVAHATGLAKIPGFDWLVNKIPFENIVYIAIRDIDPDEWINIKKLKIKSFTMDHVTQLGIGEVLKKAVAYLDPVGDKKFHISFDIDAIDPLFAFGTGTKFRGGLSPIQANQIVRQVAHQRHLVGLDVMEINPRLEFEEGRLSFRGEHRYGLVSPTVGLGLDLVDSLFTEYFTL